MRLRSCGLVLFVCLLVEKAHQCYSRRVRFSNRILVALLAVCLPLAAHAEDTHNLMPGPAPVTLLVGKTYAVCKSLELLCPAYAPICDDLSIAIPDDGGPDGLVWKAVRKGTTLCSAAGSNGMRRVFRITVK